VERGQKKKLPISFYESGNAREDLGGLEEAEVGRVPRKGNEVIFGVILRGKEGEEAEPRKRNENLPKKDRRQTQRENHLVGRWSVKIERGEGRFGLSWAGGPGDHREKAMGAGILFKPGNSGKAKL